MGLNGSIISIFNAVDFHLLHIVRKSPQFNICSNASDGILFIEIKRLVMSLNGSIKSFCIAVDFHLLHIVRKS